MRRRTFLAAVGGGVLAGCTSGPGRDDAAGGGTTADDADLPEGCPTTQGLDVEWPDELDASTVERFVTAYEHRYYREVVVEYDPESSLASYELTERVSDGPTAVGDGYEVEVSGGGAIYRPTLLLGASVTDAPGGADVVPVSEIDDRTLTETLREAAESGEAEHHVDDPGSEVDRYVDLLDALSEDFDGELLGRGDSDWLYVDVDGTTVKLTAQVTSFHGDYGWTARYYVDERVVRRTAEESVDPENGALLECRRSG